MAKISVLSSEITTLKLNKNNYISILNPSNSMGISKAKE